MILLSLRDHFDKIGLTDKKGNKMAVNRGLNPGAGVQIMSFQQEKKPVFFIKYFLNIIPP
jgi:hypothetical protein